MTAGSSGNGTARWHRYLLYGVAAAGSGLVAGWLLGKVAVGDVLYGAATTSEIPSSFAELSGNPDSVTTDSQPLAPRCIGCADGAAAAARLRHARYDRRGDAYRALDPVAIEYPVPTAGEADGLYAEADGPASDPLANAGAADTSTTVSVRNVGNSRMVILSGDSVPAVPTPQPVAVALPAAKPQTK